MMPIDSIDKAYLAILSRAFSGTIEAFDLKINNRFKHKTSETFYETIKNGNQAS